MARTEDEKITRAPITVTLGGEEYEIAPLVIRDSRSWRSKVIKLIAPFPDMVNVTTDTPEDFTQVLTTVLVTMPDEVIGLFFEYAKNLNREEIEGKATDAELTQAFKEVVALAFPLAQGVPDVMRRLYGTPEEIAKPPRRERRKKRSR